MLQWGKGETPCETLSHEAIINQQAFLNTAFMFFGVIVAFLLYHVYVLFQARRTLPQQHSRNTTSDRIPPRRTSRPSS
jgi:hypothetical protein